MYSVSRVWCGVFLPLVVVVFGFFFWKKWWKGKYWVGLQDSSGWERFLGKVTTEHVLWQVSRFLYLCEGHWPHQCADHWPFEFFIHTGSVCSESKLLKQISLVSFKNEQPIAQSYLVYIFPGSKTGSTSQQKKHNYMGFSEGTTGQRHFYTPHCEKGKSLWRCPSHSFCIRRHFFPEQRQTLQPSCFVCPSLYRLLCHHQSGKCFVTRNAKGWKVTGLRSSRLMKKAAACWTPIQYRHSSKLFIKTEKIQHAFTENSLVGFSP